jgi:hypothetical protein
MNVALQKLPMPDPNLGASASLSPHTSSMNGQNIATVADSRVPNGNGQVVSQHQSPSSASRRTSRLPSALLQGPFPQMANGVGIKSQSELDDASIGRPVPVHEDDDSSLPVCTTLPAAKHLRRQHCSTANSALVGKLSVDTIQEMLCAQSATANYSQKERDTGRIMIRQNNRSACEMSVKTTMENNSRGQSEIGPSPKMPLLSEGNLPASCPSIQQCEVKGLQSLGEQDFILHHAAEGVHTSGPATVVNNLLALPPSKGDDVHSAQQRECGANLADYSNANPMNNFISQSRRIQGSWSSGDRHFPDSREASVLDDEVSGHSSSALGRITQTGKPSASKVYISANTSNLDAQLGTVDAI